jgi:protein TonB
MRIIEMKNKILAFGLMVFACTTVSACPNSSGDPSQTRERTGGCACAEIPYPMESLRNEDQGTVRAAYLVDVDGTILESKIVKSSGYPALDKAALTGMTKCGFRPGRSNGQPVKAWAEMTYVWTIK